MFDVNEVLRMNPRAAVGFDAVRQTFSEIEKLREAGFASKPELLNPHGDRVSLSEMKESHRRGGLPGTMIR